MFDGIQRRVVSVWFQRLASDRVLRLRPIEGPFALTHSISNTNRIYFLNVAAERLGLSAGMPFSDARAFCPELQSRPADPLADRHFQHALRRWAVRYCPWVGLEDGDGLVLDITGTAHLFGGEAELLMDMRQRLSRAGITARIGLSDNSGASWALAHHGEGSAPVGAALDVLHDLPIAALRLEEKTVTGLGRLGLRTIGELANAPRAPLSRRFGSSLLMRLDQALGQQPEQITPLKDPPHYGVRMTLPDPIGIKSDVMEGTSRLLTQLCSTLKSRETGARILALTLRRVD